MYTSSYCITRYLVDCSFFKHLFVFLIADLTLIKSCTMMFSNGIVTQTQNSGLKTGRKRNTAMNNLYIFTYAPMIFSNNSEKEQPNTDSWSQSLRCQPSDCVPKVIRRPGILTGYRPADQPWSYYFRSLFWIHNETGNIWTHLLAPVLCISLVYSFSRDLNFSADASTHGLLLFTVTSTLSFISSTVAHLLHNKSELAHYILFSMDYIGIALYGYGFGMMLYYSSGNKLFYDTMGHYFPVVHSLLTSNITLCCFIARTKYRHRHSIERKCLQVVSSAVAVIFSEVVVMFRIYSEIKSNDISITRSYHMYQLIFSVTNGLSFAMHQPEKSYPGKFDIWGHGHQWFHISVACCALSQLYASYEDLLTLDRSVLNMAEPNVGIIWGSLVVFIVLNVSILAFFYPKFKNITRCK